MNMLGPLHLLHLGTAYNDMSRCAPAHTHTTTHICTPMEAAAGSMSSGQATHDAGCTGVS